MIDLRLQIAPVLITNPSGQQRASNTSSSTRQRSRNECRDDRAT
jgi:hypothetical protein